MYRVIAEITYTMPDGWKRFIQIPTFFLDENVQGIVNEQHCMKIVLEILNPLKDENVVVSATINKE